MADDEVLNPAALRRLEEWGGPTLVGKMVALFLENAPERMESIRSGAAEGNLSKVERGAHSLKSSAANLGAERLRDDASRMEKAAERRDGDEIRDLLPDMDTHFQDTLRALRAHQEEQGE